MDAIELLKARKALNSRYGAREDAHHLALAVEGGGMRGVVAGGVATALYEDGFYGCFDSVHGSSSGACAAAYLVAEQAELGTRIYYEDIHDDHLIDLSAPLKGKPILDGRFLVDEVMRMRKRLDVDKINARADFLHIVATNAENGHRVVFQNYSGDEIFEVLKATTHIPALCGRGEEWAGMTLCDGGLREQIPVDSALDAGATHVIALVTRRRAHLERDEEDPLVPIEALGLRLFFNKRIQAAVKTRNRRINRTLKKIDERRYPEGVAISAIVRSDDATDLDRLTRDPGLLKRGAREGEEAVRRALS